MNYQEILEELKWNSCSYAEEDCYNCNVEDKQACSNMRILCKQAAKMMEEIKRERDAVVSVVAEIANTDYCHNFQNGDFWVVNFINQITQIQKKAKELSRKHYDLCDQYEVNI